MGFAADDAAVALEEFEADLAAGKRTTTTDSSTKFIAGARVGTVVTGESLALHRGRTSWVWDVSMSDDADRICAVTRMTIVPGFIDTHNHPGGEVLLYEVLVGNPFAYGDAEQFNQTGDEQPLRSSYELEFDRGVLDLP